MINKDGFEPCSLCDNLFHISDPQTFSPSEDKVICKTCFYSIVENTSWHKEVKPRIVFQYTKVSIPHSLKWEVWKRDNFQCKECGTTDKLSVDHICPESFGGTLDMENLQTLCRSCNSSKNNRV